MTTRSGYDTAEAIPLETVRRATEQALRESGVLQSATASMAVAKILLGDANYYGDTFNGRVIRWLEQMTERGEAVKEGRRKYRRNYATYETPEHAAERQRLNAERDRQLAENSARLAAIDQRLNALGLNVTRHLTLDDWEALLALAEKNER
jgi:hypothetical protein